MGPNVTTPQQLWRTEFDRQLTDEMMERVIKQTTSLVRWIQRRTPWRDLQTVDDRLHTAIVKILDRTLQWEPERVGLEQYLLWAVAGDISHELEHAKKFRRVPIDGERELDDDLEREMSDAIGAEREGSQETPTTAWWSLAMGEFRKQARGDKAVLAMVEAFGCKKLTRQEVMAHTGMTSRQYVAAYKRLTRTAERIDGNARNFIMQTIV